MWGLAFALAAVLWAWGGEIAPWAVKYPRAWIVPLKFWISDAMTWLVEDATFGLFTFTELTRGISWAIERPYRLALGLLSHGLLQGQGSDAVQILPPLTWISVVAMVVALGRYTKDWTLAALAGGCFAYLAVFGQWQGAMITLASILIAVPFGIAGGLFAGLASYRWRPVERIIRPVLDLMQTVPVFAYLVPILFLFGFGPVSAIVATIVYAMPPMVRITILALRAVPEESRDLGHMVGCSARQMTWKIMVPSAMPGLMVGVNQVIMLTLNMVIIASMIGAGGLGFEVLSSLRRLDIGAGIESGVAIVVLAIALDRLSQALANKTQPAHIEAAARQSLWRRHPYTSVCLIIVFATGLAGLAAGWVQSYPEAWAVTTGSMWDDLVRWINVNYFDQLEAVKTAILLNILIPFKRLLLGLPWVAVVAFLAAAGWALGGWRLALLCALLSSFIALVGLWPKSMITVYLCGISVIFAGIIGIPIGILAAERERVWSGVKVAIDTLQTLPSFVYLMPVVMLFRVGDFAAMIAVVAYALAPAIRYTAHGIRRVDPQLIDAGIACGCTRFQILTKIKLKLALPEIMLGINQTIMLALSMLVITALVGTRDLGQEVYIALTKADTGRGIVAGLCVAFIAIIADRLITAGARRAKARLGLE